MKVNAANGITVGDLREWVDEWGEKEPVIVTDINCYPYTDEEERYTELLVEYMKPNGSICEIDIMNFCDWTRQIE